MLQCNYILLIKQLNAFENKEKYKILRNLFMYCSIISKKRVSL